MKLIHTADFHLDSPMTKDFPGYLADKRRGELLGAFAKMVKDGAVNGAEVFLIAGDLFDRKRVSYGAENMVLDTIRSYPDMHFYYLKGNHDAGDLWADKDVPENLFLFSDSWKTYWEDNGNIAISGLEFTGGKEYDISDVPDLSQDVIHIVMLHGDIYSGAQQKNNRIGFIPLKHLENKGIDYLALGHIHQPLSGQLGSAGYYCYPGCPEPRGFDEYGEHGYMLLDIDADTACVNHTFVSFGTPFPEIRTDVSKYDSMVEIAGSIKEIYTEKGYTADAFLRVVLYGEWDGAKVLDTAFLEAYLSDYCRLCRVYDETTVKLDYMAFKNDFSLKGEFVRSVMADERLSEEEKKEVMRYGFLALRGEEVK